MEGEKRIGGRRGEGEDKEEKGPNKEKNIWRSQRMREGDNRRGLAPEGRSKGKEREQNISRKGKSLNELKSMGKRREEKIVRQQKRKRI